MEANRSISKTMQSDISYFEKFINTNPNQINQKNSWGLTSLMVACRLGDTRLVNMFIGAGANLDISDRFHNTALHYAVIGQRCDVVALMLSKGADVNIQDVQGNNPLHLALKKKVSQDIMEALLMTGGRHTIRVNQRNEHGCTPLHLACDGGYTDIVRLLLTSRADVNTGDNLGNTPLHLSCGGVYADIVKLLVDARADVNKRDTNGHTPLHLACYGGQTDIVYCLLGAGADVNVVNNVNGGTPLHDAVRGQCPNVVVAILLQDRVNLDVKNHNQRTPFLLAVSEGHLGIIHMLIDHEADINTVDADDNNCLHLALEKEMFRSADESLEILDEGCTKLSLNENDRLSGIAVAYYLAHHGANFYHQNTKNEVPLDRITNPDLREKIKTIFTPPLLCMFCEINHPIVEFHPCGHTLICETCCSKVPLRSCPECRLRITKKSGRDGSHVEDQFTCSICMERPWNMVFECGHTTCKECGGQLTQCHLCRKLIERKIIIKC
ncbi:E3 ubiquitin-protein ligase MIB2 [Octopus sinensis]|uniref:E3 ubiquitin-protein ligase MIB2 n=1 Tax=Octopus sinensis TaxID=2607531 RepID=A0A6P7TLZ6_9MOLL|nr:E3 ubiquitin-protein ligase MIB2 [Octopus sinensis]